MTQNTGREKQPREKAEEEFERLRQEEDKTEHPSGPAGIPPGHIIVGGESPLGENPVQGSVVSEDWGLPPTVDPDIEETGAFELEDETVI